LAELAIPLARDLQQTLTEYSGSSNIKLSGIKRIIEPGNNQ
jgi:hypothetical protein